MKKILVLASMSLFAQQAAAGTGYYLVTTYPNEGQRTVDFKSASNSGRCCRPNLAAPSST